MSRQSGVWQRSRSQSDLKSPLASQVCSAASASAPAPKLQNNLIGLRSMLKPFEIESSLVIVLISLDEPALRRDLSRERSDLNETASCNFGCYRPRVGK